MTARITRAILALMLAALIFAGCGTLAGAAVGAAAARPSVTERATGPARAQ